MIWSDINRISSSTPALSLLWLWDGQTISPFPFLKPPPDSILPWRTYPRNTLLLVITTRYIRFLSIATWLCAALLPITWCHPPIYWKSYYIPVHFTSCVRRFIGITICRQCTELAAHFSTSKFWDPIWFHRESWLRWKKRRSICHEVTIPNKVRTYIRQSVKRYRWCSVCTFLKIWPNDPCIPLP